MTTDSSVPNKRLRSIDCLSSDYCWAVGNNSDGHPTYIHWDGHSWHRVTGVFTGINVHMNSVSVVGPKDSGVSVWEADYY